MSRKGAVKADPFPDDADATLFFGYEEAPAPVVGVCDLNRHFQTGCDWLESQSRQSQGGQRSSHRKTEHADLTPGNPTGAVEGKNEDFVNNLWRIELYVKQLAIVRVYIGKPGEKGSTSGTVSQPYFVRRGTGRRLCNFQLDAIHKMQPIKGNREPLWGRLL